MKPSEKYRRRKRSRAESDRTKGGNLKRFRPWVSKELADEIERLASQEKLPRRELAERAIAAAVAEPLPSHERATVDRSKGGRFKRFDLWIDRELLDVVEAIAASEQVSKREVFARAIRSLVPVGTPVPGET